MKLPIKTQEDFNEFVASYWSEWSDVSEPKYWGVIRQFDDQYGNPIAHKIVTLNVEDNYGALAAMSHSIETANDIKDYFAWLDNSSFHANVEAIKEKEFDIFTCNEEDLSEQPKDISEQPKDILDAHIRLALLSRRIKEQGSVNLDGILSILPNLVWTNEGPYTVEDYNEFFVEEIIPPQVLAIDKIPPLFAWNPVPTGIRVANADMVRASAYIAEGTTIMHYGFMNHNSASGKDCMVEGRISAGTKLGNNTDVGAGAGFLGTLSGKNSIPMKAGKNCLIGANAEVGTPLGDNCIVATGTCFAPGTPVYDVENEEWKKAIDFANKNNLLFWNNVKTGRFEVHKITDTGEFMNEELHKN